MTRLTLLVGLLGATVGLGLVFQEGAGPQQAPVLRTLATHESPSDEQLELLRAPLDGLTEKASKLGVEVFRDGEHILMWDEDLYNMRQMDECIRGFQVLTRLLKEGKSYFKFSDLEAADRGALREILLAQGVGEAAGPALYDDSTTVGLRMSWSVHMEAGGRTAWGIVQDRDGEQPDLVSQMKRYTREQNEKFAKEELPKRKRKHYNVNDIMFRCHSSSSVNSTRRTQAIAKISQIFEKRIKTQSEAYLGGQRALQDAYRAAYNPEIGTATKGLPPAWQRQIGETLFFQAGPRGREATQDEAAAFLDDGRITKLLTSVNIGIYWMGDTVGRAHFVSTKVQR